MSKKITHIDFYLCYRCQDNCLFCSASFLMKKFKNYPLSLNEVSDFLIKIKKKGITSINFTGGEPTLYPYFESVLRLSKRLKFKVYVNTNGEKFADKNFVNKTAPFIDEVCFSFQGHNKKVHNFLVNTKGNFEKQLRALKNLSSYPIRFFSNLVVTKFNFNFLQKTTQFVFENGIQELLISNLVPEGEGLKNYPVLIVRLKKIKEIIPFLINIANSKRKIIRFIGFPMCILKPYFFYSNDLFFDSRLYVERGFKKDKPVLIQKKIFSPEYKRFKSAKCKNCVYNKICGGVFKEYYKRFGDEELNPFYE